jgi:hypothetical protein
MVHHEIDDHTQPPVVGGADECDEVAERAQPRVDAVEIRDVVAVIAVRGRVEGQEPEAGAAERLDVIQPIGETLEVADAVPVGIHERLDVQAIDDGILVPEIEHRTIPPWAARRRTRSATAKPMQTTRAGG